MHGISQRRIWSLALVGALAMAATFVPASPASAAPQLPDLKTEYSGPSSARLGETFQFGVSLTNVGTAPSDIKTIRLLGILPQGFEIQHVRGNNSAFTCQFDNAVGVAFQGQHPMFGCESSAPFPVGGTLLVKVVAKAPSQPGVHGIGIKADWQNLIPELNEQNNSSGVEQFRVRP